MVNRRKSDDGVVVTALKWYICMNGHPESTEKVERDLSCG